MAGPGEDEKFGFLDEVFDVTPLGKAGELVGPEDEMNFGVGPLSL